MTSPQSSVPSSLAHLLDDFLDSIDHLPGELSGALLNINLKANEIADLHKTLTKRRSLYLKSLSSSALSNTSNATNTTNKKEDNAQLLKRIARDSVKLELLIREKADMESQIRAVAEKQLSRLDGALKRANANIPLMDGHDGIASDVPMPDAVMDTD